MDSINDIDDEFEPEEIEPACFGCEMSHEDYAELRDEKLPYQGCRHCSEPNYLWCVRCDKPLNHNNQTRGLFDPKDICQCR
jgi:hypothetical protein